MTAKLNRQQTKGIKQLIFGTGGLTMSEYIERERLVKHYENCIDEVKNTNGVTEDFEICLKALKNQPTAAVVEVRHGKWLTWEEQFPDRKPTKKNNLGVFCNNCHSHADNMTDYCPNCGARMDGKE